MKTWALYIHTSPSGKVYVGITCKKPEDRWGVGGKNYKRCPAIYNAICKYGWDNIRHQVLAVGLSKKDAIFWEKTLISIYKNLGLSYNVTDGGEGLLGCKRQISPEWRKKISESHRGLHHSEETRQKMSKSRKGRHQREEWIKKRVMKKVTPVEALLNGCWTKFDSIKEAAEFLGICKSNIGAVCSNKRHSVNNIKFRYYDPSRIQ